ncbi:VWA domain-containing protein [Streptomyces sp. NPDC004457]
MAALDHPGPAGKPEATVTVEVNQVPELTKPRDGVTDPVRMYAVLTVSVRKHGDAVPRRSAVDHAEVLLIDHSSSMVSPPSRLAAARRAAVDALGRIPDGARFALVAGSDQATMIYPHDFRLAIADRKSRDAAEAALRACAPGGGTAMGTWLEAALEILDRPDAPASRHALLLTDGRNEEAYERLDVLRDRVERCAGGFVCDVFGIGAGWRTEELLLIAGELGGQARAVRDLTRLPGEMAALAEQAAERDITGLRLRLHYRKGVTRYSFEQVHPTRVALHPARTDRSAADSSAGGPIEEYTTAPWRTETRDYLLCVGTPYHPDEDGKELFLTEIEVAVAPGHGKRIRLPEPEAVMMRWSDDADLYSRVHPRVAHYRQTEKLRRTFEQGCAALRGGDQASAEKHFGTCWHLAVTAGDEVMKDHLRRLVEVHEHPSGQPEVRLLTRIERFDVESARIELSRVPLPDGGRR